MADWSNLGPQHWQPTNNKSSSIRHTLSINIQPKLYVQSEYRQDIYPWQVVLSVVVGVKVRKDVQHF